MKISTNETTQNSFDFSRQQKISDTLKNSSLPGSKNGTLKSDGYSSEKVDNDHINILRKEAIDANTNSIAKSIRSSVETLYKASEALESMEKHLNDVVKYFPPYPPENEDRINYLKKFNALKKQLDQVITGPKQHDDVTIINLELDLPEISTLATNKEIGQYKGKIDSAKEMIQNKHDAIVTDSNKIKGFLLG